MKHIVLIFILTIFSTAVFGLEPGKKFPNYSLKTIAGKATNSDKASTSAKLTLVEFWASWCGSCKKSVPF